MNAEGPEFISGGAAEEALDATISKVELPETVGATPEELAARVAGRDALPPEPVEQQTAEEQVAADEIAADLPSPEQLEAVAKEQPIKQIERFVDGAGRIIERLTPHSEDVLAFIGRPAGEVSFHGQGQVTMQTPHGPQQQVVVFPIKAKTIIEAFARFNEAANKFREQLMHEHRRQMLAAGAKVHLPGGR